MILFVPVNLCIVLIYVRFLYVILSLFFYCHVRTSQSKDTSLYKEKWKSTKKEKTNLKWEKKTPLLKSFK